MTRAFEIILIPYKNPLQKYRRCSSFHTLLKAKDFQQIPLLTDNVRNLAQILWNAVVIPNLDKFRSPWRRFLLSFFGIYTSGLFGHDLVCNLARCNPGRTIRV